MAHIAACCALHCAHSLYLRCAQPAMDKLAAVIRALEEDIRSHFTSGSQLRAQPLFDDTAGVFSAFCPCGKCKVLQQLLLAHRSQYGWHNRRRALRIREAPLRPPSHPQCSARLLSHRRPVPLLLLLAGMESGVDATQRQPGSRFSSPMLQEVKQREHAAASSLDAVNAMVDARRDPFDNFSSSPALLPHQRTSAHFARLESASAEQRRSFALSVLTSRHVDAIIADVELQCCAPEAKRAYSEAAVLDTAVYLMRHLHWNAHGSEAFGDREWIVVRDGSTTQPPRIVNTVEMEKLDKGSAAERFLERFAVLMQQHYDGLTVRWVTQLIPATPIYRVFIQLWDSQRLPLSLPAHVPSTSPPSPLSPLLLLPGSDSDTNDEAPRASTAPPSPLLLLPSSFRCPAVSALGADDAAGRRGSSTNEARRRDALRAQRLRESIHMHSDHSHRSTVYFIYARHSFSPLRPSFAFALRCACVLCTAFSSSACPHTRICTAPLATTWLISSLPRRRLPLRAPMSTRRSSACRCSSHRNTSRRSHSHR